MLREWRIEFNQFLLLLAIGGGGGWMLGYPGVGFALISVPYCLWLLFRIKDMSRWLKSGAESDPPESTGVWGNMLDQLYQLQRRYKADINNLHQIITRAQQSTDAIKDAVVVVNKHGDLEWWNEAGGRLLGLKVKSDRGQSLTNLLRDPRFIQYFEAGNFDKPLDLPSTLNPNVVLQFQITAFGDGERLMVTRDVSRIHHLEKMRQDFVANVSHELRTPLTVIKGYLETFIDTLNSDQPHLKRGLSQMHQQTQRMELLINDLLLLARLESDDKERTMTPVSVPKILRQIHNDALAINESKQHKIILDIDTNLIIYGDENELRSAFSNLMMNAIKYTPENGRIELRWWADEEGVYLEVEDDGIGIDEKHLPRLTERFYRADQSRHAKSGGTGLGLAIVKHVLLHHDAKLEIVSDPGEGSVFTCRFPTRLTVKKENQSVA
ncbi:MAG: phosphate regulon sensor histidine kinase PhoR [Ketobacter sp.]|nr:MAG: phosphate regulon sensor histidine kinase PhoR [Ketobacter sp.]